ncbi:MAG: proprotein convertase P-domain-containing protein [bacterium]|nr:proprotein convertase P-domain-containing protein [bacterium]
MKRLMTLCMMLAVAAMAYAGKVETKKADDVKSPALSISNTEIPVNLADKIADLEAQLAELRATGGDQSAVRAMLEKYRALDPRAPHGNPALDRLCTECTPENADLGFIGNVTYAYFISGDCGTDGKWVGRFDGVPGTVYHWDLCSTAPGAGTNAGFDAVSDCDIRVRDAACTELAYTDGLSGCVPSWSPNDFQWTCVTAGTYYVEIMPYSGGCLGTVDMTFTMNYYGAGVMPAGPGENCSTSWNVPGLPFSDTGNTCSFANDYDAVCPYTGGTAPDVAYNYTPSVDQTVTFSLCLSGYDTKLYIYDGAPTPGGQIACNDDASPCPGSTGSFRSYLECVQLYAGHRYCIIVDGYGSSCGDYALTMEECAACDVICPVGATPEGEVSCGDEYIDTYNGGCNVDPAAFGSIACNEVICGTAWTYLNQGANYRDTDWYSFTVTEDMDSNLFCVTTEFSGLFFIFPAAPCADINGGLVPAIFSAPTLPCVELCYNACMLPGDYIAIVLPANFTGVPCGSEYVLSRSCQPCAVPFVCHCGEGANTHCTYATDNTSYPIDSAIPTTCVTINVPVEYQITDLNVCLDIVHTFDGDLDIFLTSPMGTVIELTTDNGSSGQNFTCTTFDDEAATSVTLGTAPFSGSFSPETALSAVDGENAVGAWVLCITDDAGGDVGWLNYVCLTFTYDHILPVAFGSFDAVVGNEQVTLNWNTESETSVAGFEVLRDGAKVADVAAQNSSSGANYSYTDGNLTNGTTYVYTLVSVDVNGDRVTLATQSATPVASSVVSEYALHQNYPNPFNPTTNIAFDMVEAGHVSISIFNVMGQKVGELVNGNMEAGRHVVNFDATGLSSGLYLYKMEANGFTAQSKMILMK